MHAVNMHQVKTKLSSLLDEVLQGEEVVIAKAGKPLVRLVPFHPDKKPRKPGRLKGRIKMAPDFDQTPEVVIKAFEQSV